MLGKTLRVGNTEQYKQSIVHHTALKKKKEEEEENLAVVCQLFHDCFTRSFMSLSCRDWMLL